MEQEEDDEEIKITEYIEKKEITGGRTNFNIAGKAKQINIKGGKHTIKITSHVDTLSIFGGIRELNIKSSIDNLIIKGGVSKIYIHNYGNTQVNNINIFGGTHEIYIYLFVNELSIKGGVSKIICNFEHSKINKIKTTGGQREIFLNKNTKNAKQENEGGSCNVQITEIMPEPPWYQESISEKEIPITTLENQKMREPCAICLTEFKSGEEVYFLPCIHCFHIQCLRGWVKKSKTCPNCKFELRNKLA